MVIDFLLPKYKAVKIQLFTPPPLTPNRLLFSFAQGKMKLWELYDT